MKPLRVLVVDDEVLARRTTRQQLEAAGYEAAADDNAFAALERLEREPWDVVVTDLRMPTMDGLTFLGKVKEILPDLDVIVITAHGSVESAVAAMRGGAADYLTKPFKFDELRARLERLGRMHAMRRELAQLRELLAETSETCGLVVRSPGMRQVWERIRLFADHDAPVLVTGETGTGKELVAQALHRLSGRREAPFVAVASGAIPRDLAESELFGHEKGAFTGALRLRRGSFERAHGGTLLLDDVDDLPLEIQVKLLRVIQEGQVLRVGAAQEIEVDVRLVATTKKDLEEEVAKGRFRDDLYYRLCGLEIHLPPLRERGEEVLALAQHFLAEMAARRSEAPKALSPQAVALLRSYAWPGNVRELRRTMESATALCSGSEVAPVHLPRLRPGPGPHGEDSDSPRLFSLHLGEGDEVSLPALVRQFEDEVIEWALSRSGGKQNRAAEILAVPRSTLQTKLASGKGSS